MHTEPQLIAFMQSDKLKSSRLIFDGSIIQVYYNQIQLENGMEVNRELIHHLPAVGIIAETDREELILVSQYRAAVDQHLLEIPAGILDITELGIESPKEAGQRELEEETGYVGENWEYVGKTYVSPGYLDELIYLYYAKGLTVKDEPLAPDDDEDITLQLYSVEEIEKLIQEDKINDMKTLYVLSWWLNRKRGGSQDVG